MTAPYQCPLCERELEEGDRVIPYYVVESADFLVRTHPGGYAHLKCSEGV